MVVDVRQPGILLEIFRQPCCRCQLLGGGRAFGLSPSEPRPATSYCDAQGQPHHSPNEQIHYSAEGIGYRLIRLPTQGELLMEFDAEGYAQVQSTCELQGLDLGATRLI